MTANQPLIAVVEDEAPIRRFLRASLTAEGFTVLEAESVAQGLRTITQDRPDLVLLDLGLPDGDGLQIVKEVRGWSSLPIIVLSAHGEEKNKIAALDAGADDYLTKPFSVGELLARIRVALRHTARLNKAEEAEQTVFEFRTGKRGPGRPPRLPAWRRGKAHQVGVRPVGRAGAQ
jgi:two-component system KDP operon response regulator KdpE